MGLTTRIAFREIIGGWRSLIIFYICVILGVTVIGAVGSISKNLSESVTLKSRSILGGDVEISATNFEVGEDILSDLKQFGQFSLAIELRAMMRANGQARLIELKGVGDLYPLYGKLKLKGNKGLHTELQGNGAVVDEELLYLFDLKIGDEIKIGEKSFYINGVIESEPDRIVNAFVIGPRVMVSSDNIKASGLVKPASLLRFRYRIKLDDPTKVEEFLGYIKEKYPDNPWRIRDHKAGNSVITDAIERFELFLTLAGFANLLICGIGIGTATRHFLEKKSMNIAILKSVGATRKDIIITYLKLIFAITLDAIIFSAILAAVITYFAFPHLAVYFPIEVEFNFYWKPILLAAWFGIITVFSFSAPALLSAADIKPVTLFRGANFFEYLFDKKKLIVYIALIAILIASLVFTSSEPQFAFGFTLMALFCVLVLIGLSFFIKRVARTCNSNRPWLRLAITNLYRPGSSVTTILLAMGIGLTVMISLAVVEGNLEERLDEAIPKRAPSVFLVDVQPYQIDNVLKVLGENLQVSNIIYKPNIQGRFTHINGVPVDEVEIRKDARWAIRSFRRLSYAGEKPKNTKMNKGQWWPKDYDGPPLVSFDKNLARGMGVGIGDKLTFNITGKTVEAEIASLRDIDYTSFQINFAIIFSPGVLEDFPHSYFITIKVDSLRHEVDLINELADEFPNVTSVRIRDGVKIAKDVIGQVTTAIEVITLITLISGVVVLAGSFVATMDRRIYDTVIFKVLGARRRDIFKSYFAEWIVLALCSSLFALILGNIGGYLVLEYFNAEEFYFLYGVMFETILIMIAGVTLIGFLGNIKAFQAKPLSVLRNE